MPFRLRIRLADQRNLFGHRRRRDVLGEKTKAAAAGAFLSSQRRLDG